MTGDRFGRERGEALEAMDAAWDRIGTRLLHASQHSLRRLASAWTAPESFAPQERGPVLLTVLAAQPGAALTTAARCLLAAEHFISAGRYRAARSAALSTIQTAPQSDDTHAVSPPIGAASDAGTGTVPPLEVERAATLRALELTWLQLGSTLSRLHSSRAHYDSAAWVDARTPLSVHPGALLSRLTAYHHPYLRRGAALLARARDTYLSGNDRAAAIAAGDATVQASSSLRALLALAAIGRSPRQADLSRTADRTSVPDADHSIAPSPPPGMDLS